MNRNAITAGIVFAIALAAVHARDGVGAEDDLQPGDPRRAPEQVAVEGDCLFDARARPLRVARRADEAIPVDEVALHDQPACGSR